jgi:hypothetical protein
MFLNDVKAAKQIIGVTEHHGVTLVSLHDIFKRLEEISYCPWWVLHVTVHTACVILYILLISQVAYVLKIG